MTLAADVLSHRHLNVAPLVGTDPDVAPGWRDHQCIDAFPHLRFPNEAPVGMVVAEPAAPDHATDTRLLV